MRPSIFSISLLLACCTSAMNATEAMQESTLSVTQTIEPFTGKITRNKVRLRLQASLDAHILYELNRDDLLVVVGERDEFYAVLPPKDTKAYVFRTFVLDNIVEGNRVNVRLEPALEAPVIGQLNNGDRIEGSVSSLNSKWLEILPPDSTRFYVCKEYVEKIGSSAMVAQIEKRRTEVNALLSSARLISEGELQKNYQEINLDAAIANLNTIIKQYTDFPKPVEQAKELLTAIQEQYLQKKISFLEVKAYQTEMQMQPSSPPQQLQKDSTISQPKSVLFTDQAPERKDPNSTELTIPLEIKKAPNWHTPFDSSAMTAKMATWVPVEYALYEIWNKQQNGGSPKEFYEQQFAESISLKGTVEPYSRTIRNKPGDYLLVSPVTNLPIAYLYSTRVDLQESVGREIVLHAVARPNNNFAFSAYYIISTEQ